MIERFDGLDLDGIWLRCAEFLYRWNRSDEEAAADEKFHDPHAIEELLEDVQRLVTYTQWLYAAHMRVLEVITAVYDPTHVPEDVARYARQFETMVESTNGIYVVFPYIERAPGGRKSR
jgi:hypothetical protein